MAIRKAKKTMFNVQSKYMEYQKLSNKEYSKGSNASKLSKYSDNKKMEMLEYDPKSRNMLKKNQTLTFIPKINKRSKNIKRDLNISDYLHRDASERRNSRYPYN